MKNTKVAIHSVPSLTKSGFYCLKWPTYLVVVGANPLGVRGGHCGGIVDGEVVEKFRNSVAAQAHVEKLVISKGYILV